MSFYSRCRSESCTNAPEEVVLFNTFLAEKKNSFCRPTHVRAPSSLSSRPYPIVLSHRLTGHSRTLSCSSILPLPLGLSQLCLLSPGIAHRGDGDQARPVATCSDGPSRKRIYVNTITQNNNNNNAAGTITVFLFFFFLSVALVHKI